MFIWFLVMFVVMSLLFGVKIYAHVQPKTDNDKLKVYGMAMAISFIVLKLVGM